MFGEKQFTKAGTKSLLYKISLETLRLTLRIETECSEEPIKEISKLQACRIKLIISSGQQCRLDFCIHLLI
jgi:hypothetical protein